MKLLIFSFSSIFLLFVSLSCCCCFVYLPCCFVFLPSIADIVFYFVFYGDIWFYNVNMILLLFFHILLVVLILYIWVSCFMNYSCYFIYNILYVYVSLGLSYYSLYMNIFLPGSKQSGRKMFFIFFSEYSYRRFVKRRYEILFYISAHRRFGGNADVRYNKKWYYLPAFRQNANVHEF